MAKIGDVIHNPVTGERITFLQTAQSTGGSLLQIELVIQPGGFPLGEHTHPKQEERFKVLAGQLTAWRDKQVYTLTAGDEFVIPAGTPHYWTNQSKEEAKVIVEFRPALRWEMLFESIFGLARDGKTDKRGRPNPFQTAVIFDEFKDEAAPVVTFDRLLFKLFPLFAVFGRAMGYKAIYPEYTQQR